ncbi:MAG: hypothetical protein IKX03_06910 [Bacteroidales bacterium]|nr:hypothetical protein [Bacteroidales bacterium]
MRYSRFVSIAFAALFAVACEGDKSPFSEDASLSDPAAITISATLETPAEAARTSLKDGTKVIWSQYDAFALMTATTKDRFAISSGAGTTSATFSGTTSGSGPFYALYPYSPDCSVSDGYLSFFIPKAQKYVAGSFDAGVSPSLATMDDLNAIAEFKNLFGILQLNLCGSGKVRKVEVVDLAGTPLWGDCRVLLDGKQGTAEQTLEMTGGSNKLIMEFISDVSLLASSPRVLNFVVPPGSFSKGVSVRVFEPSGSVTSFLTAQNPEIRIARSNITKMDKVKIPSNGEPADERARGFHKDVFMDAGNYLTQRTAFYAADFLGWKKDFMTTEDSLLQRSIVVESEEDENGCLLYPDNNPRYRMIYVNGGAAGNHGRSLTSTGLSRYRSFVNHGGAYVGSCAGGFFAAKGSKVGVNNQYYLGIYPSTVFQTGLFDARVSMTIPEYSKLLEYYVYGGDFRVDSIYHNGGGYVTDATLPAGAEILARYDHPGKDMHGNGSVWAYKADEKTGRVVTTGSHPEFVNSGDRRELMAAMIRYATEGIGIPQVKGELKNGETRVMDRYYSDYKPANARIGDGQYHHFTVEIPENVEDFKLELQSSEEANLHLTMRKEGFAWMTDADFLLIQKGSDKTLEIPSLAPGTWYVGVYCAEKVTVSCGVDKFECSGNIDALSGIPYSLTASWK